MSELLYIYYNPYSLFVWGACWGSFLNVVLYRYPLGKSVVTPPSSCPSCQRLIPWYENIPVFSWFYLAGKCRGCQAPFSIRYALNEAFYGVIWSVGAIIWPDQPLAGSSASLATMALVPSAWLFLRHKKAPAYLWITLLVAIGIHLGQLFLG